MADVVAGVEAFLGHKVGETFNLGTSPHQQLAHGQSISSVEGDTPNGFFDENTRAMMLNQSVDAESFFNDLGGKSNEESTWQQEERSNEQPAIEEADESIQSQRLQSTVGGSKTNFDAPRLSVDARDYSTGADFLIKTSLLVGQRHVAVEMCIKSERWADALLLSATSGDSVLWEKTQVTVFDGAVNNRYGL